LFGSFLPSLLVGQPHQLYSGIGADIVMESIAQVTESGIQFRDYLRYALITTTTVERTLFRRSYCKHKTGEDGSGVAIALLTDPI